MACIRRIRIRKTKFVDREFLLKALDDLGYSWDEGGRLGTSGPRLDFKLRGHEAGFRKTENGYDFVHRRSGIDLDEINQSYVYHAARAQLETQGFELAQEEVDESGQIHLVLRRMK